ncbi:hypothetical protein NMY22_g15625 [Coprinellus aureogranulatus]|nr:hypothetical protein NMY22_g15625 [Coprinellus aureogranulatus]
MRVTTSRTTGLSPFFMIYGVHPVFSFDLQDGTWGVLDWDKVQSTTDLIVLRTLQITQRDQIAEEAHKLATVNRQKSIDNWNRKMRTEDFHDFQVGMYVLRYESWIELQHGHKNRFKWTGPYIIHEVRPNKSFVLRELDGTVIRGHVTAHRLRLFFFRDERTLLRSVSNANLYYRYLQAGSSARHDHPDPLSRKIADMNPSCFATDVNGDHECQGFECIRSSYCEWSIQYIHGTIHIPSFDSNLFKVDARFFSYIPYHWWTGSIRSIPGLSSSLYADEHASVEHAAIEDTLSVISTYYPRLVPVRTEPRYRPASGTPTRYLTRMRLRKPDWHIPTERNPIRADHPIRSFPSPPLVIVTSDGV